MPRLCAGHQLGWCSGSPSSVCGRIGACDEFHSKWHSFPYLTCTPIASLPYHANSLLSTIASPPHMQPPCPNTPCIPTPCAALLHAFPHPVHPPVCQCHSPFHAMHFHAWCTPRLWPHTTPPMPCTPMPHAPSHSPTPHSHHSIHSHASIPFPALCTSMSHAVDTSHTPLRSPMPLLTPYHHFHAPVLLISHFWHPCETKCTASRPPSKPACAA